MADAKASTRQRCTLLDAPRDRPASPGFSTALPERGERLRLALMPSVGGIERAGADPDATGQQRLAERRAPPRPTMCG